MRKKILSLTLILTLLCISCEQTEKNTIQADFDKTSQIQKGTERIEDIETTKIGLSSPKLYPERMFDTIAENLEDAHLMVINKSIVHDFDTFTIEKFENISTFFKGCTYTECPSVEELEYNNRNLIFDFPVRDNDGNVYNMYGIEILGVSNCSDGNVLVKIQSANDQINGEPVIYNSYITTIQDFNGLFQLFEMSITETELTTENMFDLMLEPQNLETVSLMWSNQDSMLEKSEVQSTDVEKIATYFSKLNYIEYSNSEYLSKANGNHILITFLTSDRDGNTYAGYGINFYEVSNLDEGNCVMEIIGDENKRTYITNVDNIQSVFEDIRTIF